MVTGPRRVILGGTRQGGTAPSLPNFALVDRVGNPIVDRFGNYIISDPTPRTI